MSELLIGGIGVLLATTLGGATGFGYGLVATPALLAAGIPIDRVVAANLAIALLTRLIPAWQLRRHLVWPRAGRLIAGSVPGILAGYGVRDLIDTDGLRIFAGAMALTAALALAFRSHTGNRHDAPERAGASDARTPGVPGRDPAVRGTPPSAALLAGMGGGFLGVTTALNGIPPALLLARDRVRPLPFIADLTVYFVVGNVITLAIVTAGDPALVGPVAHYVLIWLPIGVIGNQIGIRCARRIPSTVCRMLTLAVVTLAGLVTIGGAL